MKAARIRNYKNYVYYLHRAQMLPVFRLNINEYKGATDKPDAEITRDQLGIRKDTMKAKLTAICGLAALALGAHSAAVNASTVFIATDGDVNFFALPNPPYTSAINLSGSRQVAIFDDTDTSFASSSATVLNSTNNTSIALFTPAGPNTSVAVSTIGSSMSLSGDGRFILGYYNGSSWIAESGVTNLNNNIWEVTFTDGSFFQIDATVVPVPAAAWLFGAGLVGLIGVARRKQR